MKMKLKLLFKAVLFTVILFVILDSLGYLLQDAPRVYPTGQDAKDTDVALIGSSHVNGDLIPQKIFDDHGYTCWNIAPAEPGIENTYYALKEVNEKIRPKAFVIELLMAAVDSSVPGEYNFKTNLAHEMSLFSKNHLDAALVGTRRFGIEFDYYYNILRAHSNYSNLKRADYNFWAGKDIRFSQMGYSSIHGDQIMVYKNPDPYSVSDLPATDFEPLPAAKEFIDKILEYADQEQLELIFLISPDSRVAKHEHFKWLNHYITDRGYNVYDFNTREGWELMDFDPDSDMSDTNHLNDQGSLKYTSVVGTILGKNFELADHRTDPGYEAWKRRPYAYVSRMEAEKLNDQTDLAGFMSIAQTLDDQYITIAGSSINSSDLSQYGIDPGTVCVKNGETKYSGPELSLNICNYVLYAASGDQVITEIDHYSSFKNAKYGAVLVFDTIVGKTVDKIYINENGEISR